MAKGMDGTSAEGGMIFSFFSSTMSSWHEGVHHYAGLEAWVNLVYLYWSESLVADFK